MTDAITRQEKLLAGVSIKPITREEMFLAKLAGQNVNTPEPITRKEKLMHRIIDNGISGGGDENFVGVKLSNFTEDGYKLPRVADARSLQKIIDSLPGNAVLKAFITTYLFSNSSVNGNGGLYAELEEVYIPDGLVGLSYTFQNCSKLKKIHGDLSSVIGLGSSFYNCKSLTDIPYMPNLTDIANNSFNGCSSLTKANLYIKPSAFNANAFGNCPKLLDIYVPWSEGEVANAPWGAKNATIHYNTVYDENHEPIV